MSSSYTTIIARRLDGPVAAVALNRPEAANALNTVLAGELKDFFTGLDAAFRAVVLTGQGRHFCAGADLKERRGMDEAQWHAQHAALEGALKAVLDCPVPVIAAVGGAAFGGGLELALACDFIYAAPDARFGLTETTLGIMSGMGGTQNLPRAVGPARARELIFTGRPFSAQEALDWGMVNRLCPAKTLLDEAIACAAAIAANAPLAVKAAKKAINQGINLDLGEAMQAELRQYETLLGTRDRHEGINAFNEKRKPSFSGS